MTNLTPEVSRHIYKIPMPERFWMRVKIGKPDECWEWQGWRANRKFSYGSLIVNGIRKPAHRVAYELHHGTTIPEGLWGLHKCDNPPCCNPHHIFLGTHQDNIDDMLRKGRGYSNPKHMLSFGEDHPKAKMTNQQAGQMRQMYATRKYKQKTLAALFGLTQSSASDVLDNKSYHDPNYIPVRTRVSSKAY